MNTALGVALSVLAGMLLWGVPRILTQLPPLGIRIFWVSLVAGLIATIWAPEPYNLSAMGLLAGMAAFENLYGRHLIKMAAKKAVKDASLKSENDRRKAKRKGIE